MELACPCVHSKIRILLYSVLRTGSNREGTISPSTEVKVEMQWPGLEVGNDFPGPLVHSRTAAASGVVQARMATRSRPLSRQASDGIGKRMHGQASQNALRRSACCPLVSQDRGERV